MMQPTVPAAAPACGHVTVGTTKLMQLLAHAPAHLSAVVTMLMLLRVMFIMITTES